MSLKGIDVSEFQGIIDWEKVKASGVQFAMIRAGYGYGTIDKQFHRNAAECNRIGLPIGAYWFCYALNGSIAIQEAKGCLQAISSHRFDFPICYDIEQASVNYAAQNGITYTPSLATTIVHSFCTQLENHGYYAMFYTNQNFLLNYLPQNLAKRYALWYAFYNSYLDNSDCGIWQYTNAGSIPGISGNVDLDIGYIDYAPVIKEHKLNRLKESSSITYYTIRPGDTLSEIAARYHTTAAALGRLNGITNLDLIYAGQTIRIS